MTRNEAFLLHRIDRLERIIMAVSEDIAAVADSIVKLGSDWAARDAADVAAQKAADQAEIDAANQRVTDIQAQLDNVNAQHAEDVAALQAAVAGAQPPSV